MLGVRTSGVVLVPEHWGCARILSSGVLGVRSSGVVLVPERWGCARILQLVARLVADEVGGGGEAACVVGVWTPWLVVCLAQVGAQLS